MDHLVPLHAGGSALPPLEEVRLVHYGCNSRRGNRTRVHGLAREHAVQSAVELRPEPEPKPVLEEWEPPAPRRRRGRRPNSELVADAQTKLFVVDAPSSDVVDDFFSGPETGPSPETPVLSRIPPLSIGMVGKGGDSVELVPPRLETRRPSDVTGSYGAEACEWIRVYLRDDLRPWQRHALERILEHREDGSLRWRRVILTVSRQSGKSILSRGLCGWRVCSGRRFGEPQEVLHVANVRDTAKRIWAPAADRLERAIRAHVRRSNGQEALELRDGSAWRLAASTLDGGVGSSVSLAFVDEAWRVSRNVIDGSIAPTMLERRSPQLVLVSTAGDGGSKLLQEDRDAAIEQMDDPDTARILLLEWSAPPEAYVDDRDAWRLASPHWTQQRLDALEHAYATSSENDWRRQYLNQWVLASRSWVAPAQWADATEREQVLPPAPAGTLAVNDQDGRPGACGYALAVKLDDDRVLLRGRAFPSRRALWAELEQLTAERRGLELLYPASFERHVAQLRGVKATKVGTAEQRAGYGPTLGAIIDGRLRHDGDDELSRQILTATPVTMPDVGTTLSARRSPGPIYLARAAVWAVGAELRPERRPRAMVIAG